MKSWIPEVREGETVEEAREREAKEAGVTAEGNKVVQWDALSGDRHGEGGDDDVETPAFTHGAPLGAMTEESVATTGIETRAPATPNPAPLELEDLKAALDPVLERVRRDERKFALPTDDELPLSRIYLSPTSARASARKIEELAASLRMHGQIHAITVRPNSALGGYEVAEGERRVRAALLNAEKYGGPKSIRAVVRPLSDLEFEEIRVAENLQREDLTPIEEGECYRRLHEDHKVPIKDIAAKYGRGVRVVYDRMQLLKLGPEVRRAVEVKEVLPSVALEISRRPNHKVQAEALAGLKARGATTHEAAVEFLTSEFACQLQDAPFDRKDEFLVPEAGACATCPHNTKNQRQLELGTQAPPASADICTSPSCYRQKVAAHIAAERQRAEEKAGAKWLSQADAKRVFQGGNEVAPGGEYVGLDAPCYEDSKRRTWREILTSKGAGPKLPQVYAAASPRGTVHQVVDKVDAVKLARDLGVLGRAQAEQAGRDTGAEKRQRREDDALQRAVAQKILVAGVQRAEADGLDAVLLRVVVGVLLEGVGSARAAMEERRGHSAEQLARELPKLKEPVLRGLLLELLLGEDADIVGPGLEGLARALKLDLKKLEKDAKAERQRELELKAAAKKGKKPKAA